MEPDIDYERLREKYRPKIIELLLISEAPPSGYPRRFFYDVNTNKYDTLYLEIMSVIILRLTQGVSGERTRQQTKRLRQEKEENLRIFQGQGFWLQDVVPCPLDGKDVHKSISDNSRRIEGLINNYSVKKCILITGSVFQIKDSLIENTCIKVLNQAPLPFAGQGHQAEFRREFGKILLQNGFLKAAEH